MRVLHVITTLDVGGAERLMVDLLPLLNEENNNSVELVVFKCAGKAFYQELKSKGVSIKVLSRSRNVYNPLNLVKLLPILGSYDVVHSHNTACQFYVALASLLTRCKAKLVTTEHNSTNRRRSIRWFKPFDKWMYNCYDAIVCIADQTHNNLAEYLGNKNRLHIIHNGVDVSRFLKPIGDISNKNEYVITMVAAFRPQKDYDTLLRAMTHLPNNYRLQIVGGGDAHEGARKKTCCTQLGLDKRVDFLGIRSDIPEILEDSDVVVLSSHWEGLSLSSIECMASGRPFVASDVDGLHEIVKGAGILFPEGDDQELAIQIQNLCEHPVEYQRIARQCQERARQYDISVMAENYLKLYDGLCDEQHS